MYKNKQKTVCLNLKSLLALALLTASLAGFAGAGSALAAGFTGPGPDLVTVQQVRGMNDDAGVTLKGNIIKNLGGESYTFQDATGSIEVEIDHEIWRGQQVGPDDTVLISGEVDKDWNQITIDVDSLVKQ
ncbi:MAG: NirD/YgiW/YdeI family stress tolerance protein [Deltaproteobacteria bacterium]|jgi:uncharacterized protein (TIGR00156 family)|nr:NirD/YgiW/YdeI family stress tolerance protein [Deltaproteobacteria bacterium]